MNIKRIIATVCALGAGFSMFAQKTTVTGPDGRLAVSVGNGTYSITYDGRQILQDSPLGLTADIGDFTHLQLDSVSCSKVSETYRLDRIKTSEVSYNANVLICHFSTPDSLRMDVEFRISNNDIAFRYSLPKDGEAGAVRILSESTGYRFPDGTLTWLTAQSDAMIGWKRTKPSYEEYYMTAKPLSEKSQYGHGYTFPCLFKVGNDGWVLLGESGVDSRYCASHISDWHDGLYTIAFPMPGENNGNGTVEPAFSLPGKTPWRTITVGGDLSPIAETTVTWDVVEPRYESEHSYSYGKGTWSWILWQDGSINEADQKAYIDLAREMGFQFVLVDNWWDRTIGHKGMESLVEYAHSQGVDVFLWYSSSGWWNDISQSPVNVMDNPISRKKEMKWLQSIGVKGIKVDFFGGDKQETMRHYESILSDADDHGLMVIFHGCTIPRGWERMYPNYVGSEAVRASENLIFDQFDCDIESMTACLHPFVRNSLGCMEFGGCFLNRRLDRTNKEGNFRRTTDVFELATAILYQNPIQNFAIAPNNLTDAPAVCLDFLKEVPTTWDETRLIDGFPGRYTVLARRHADKWYIAVVNGTLRKGLSVSMADIAEHLGIKEASSAEVISGGNNPQAKCYDWAQAESLRLSAHASDAVVIIVK